MASFSPFRFNLGRLCVAAAAAQIGLIVAMTEADAQEQSRQRGAPIVYANAAMSPAGGSAAAEGASNPGMLSWRTQSPTPAASQPALDLRRTSATASREGPGQTEQSRPEWLAQEHVEAPYQQAGVWYAPTPEPGFAAEGLAGLMPAERHGQTTASGEVLDIEGLSAAHPTLPVPSLVQVTNLETGREAIVRLNDRGAFDEDQVVELSRGAARALGVSAQTAARVHVRYLGPAPRLVGDQTAATASPAQAQARAQMSTPITYAPTAAAEPVAGPPRSGFVVQLGAFSNLENARRLRASVRTLGVVSIDPIETASGEMFRVRVGPFATEQQASAAQAQAVRMGAGAGVIAELR